ncbi:hypothetical protein Tco_0842333 [Tanacetum coccineum]|uniref:Uncharacterized protein n=1 Tax=Tanacetum coccineum TaxID=301880 RepID=A0ABQ5AZW5_9ASTR
MTGNKCYLTKYEDYNGGFVSFGDGKGRILENRNQTNYLSINLDKNPKVSEDMLKKALANAWMKIEASDKDGIGMITSATRMLLDHLLLMMIHHHQLTSANEASIMYLRNIFLKDFSPLFKNAFTLPHASNVTPMDDIRIFGNAYDDEDVDAKADLNNLETTINVSPIPTTRINKYHPKDQIIGDFNSTIQIRIMTKIFDEYAMLDKANARGLLQFSTSKVGDTERIYPNSKRPLEQHGSLEQESSKRGIYCVETSQELGLHQVYVDEDHLCGSMIGSLMYLTASRPDIMFVVYACDRFQVTLKMSHLHAVKGIFRYLKGQPKLGLWYPRDSPFDLEAFSDSDYAGASLDRKSTTRGCEFLSKRLISWQYETADKEWEDRMERAATTASS